MIEIKIPYAAGNSSKTILSNYLNNMSQQYIFQYIKLLEPLLKAQNILFLKFSDERLGFLLKNTELWLIVFKFWFLVLFFVALLLEKDMIYQHMLKSHITTNAI